MRSSLLSIAALLLGVASAAPADPKPAAAAVPKPDADGKYWIHGKGISAAFVPYGASISDLLIKDKNGVVRDIVTGFDNATHYTLDKAHAHFGGVPGRYANRIKNSTFEIDGVKYKVAANDNKTPEHPEGLNTLHGGPDGWDWRNFTVSAYTNSSITFSIVDPDGKEGFPGEVVSFITYSLGDMTWDFKMVAIATTKKTPIMLTNHAYFNLDGFANDQTSLALNHTFHLPYSGQRVDVDDILIPTGDILANKKGSVNDFWSKPKQIGTSFNDPEMPNNCGAGCVGYGKHPPPLQPLDAKLTCCRQLLARQPRAKRPLRLAQGRLRRQPVVGVVGHQARHLLGPGGLPDVHVQLPGRHHAAQEVAGLQGQRQVPPNHPQVRLHRARGPGLDRRHQPAPVGPRQQADL